MIRHGNLRIIRNERRDQELPLWRGFRAWWKHWRFECVAPTRFLFIGFSVDPGEREIQVKFGCFLFAFWLSYELNSKDFWEKFHARYKYNEMEVDIDWNTAGGCVSGGFLHWKFWVTADEWNSKTPKWRDGTFHPVDWLLGSHKHSERDISLHRDVEIPMPEANYLADIRLYESSWKRPRWPFVKRIDRADIQMKTPIPHPGKGENSWDCGEDATYSMTCPARTVAEAIAAMVQSSMRSRLSYGGKNWRPEPKHDVA